MMQDTSDPPQLPGLPSLAIEVAREEDGRYLADVLTLPGVMAYGRTESEAVARVTALALRVFAERLTHGEASAEAANGG